ncbi:unannotated protein [freshwater metagenome]|uniref:Unannotated protein n=1 Tax=freshwater metagenome TaxID=449393 RepID=A0A6J6ITK8_9ZZZZ
MVVGGDARTELCASFEFRSGLAIVEHARDSDVAQLLGVTLEPAATDRKVFRHPDGDTATVGDAFVLASNDHKCFKVLRAHGVEKFGPTGTARLPVGPNHRHSAGVFVSEFKVRGKDCANVLGVRQVFDRKQRSRVKPRHLRDKCTLPGRGQRGQESIQISHGSHCTESFGSEQSFH